MEMNKVINYRIIVLTKDKTYAGTDNFIYMTMEGTDGKTYRFEIQGSQERKAQDAFNFRHEDIGIIENIIVDVSGDLADKWTPYSIKVLRNTESNDESTADGWTEFIIDKELGYDPESFNATYIHQPQITIDPFGKPVENTARLTLVQFDHNPGQNSQTVMKYTETWANVERVLISREERETIGVEAIVKYESPEFKAAGKFSVELGASWESEIANITEKEAQTINQREFDWSFEADPRSYVFRLQVFLQPFTDQVYKDSEGKSRVIRSLRSEIIPAGVGDFLFIPRMDDDGNVDPILMSELEKDWFAYMDEKNKVWIKERHLDMWLEKGWVVYEYRPPEEPTEQKAVVITDALHIREDHDPNSKILGYLKENDEVTVLETWADGNNIWAKLKPHANLSASKSQWAALLIGKNRYLKLIDDFANFPE